MQREDSHVSGMTVYEPLEGAGRDVPRSFQQGPTLRHRDWALPACGL